MAKRDFQQIQRECEAGKVWPIYWIYGPERRRARDALAQIEAALARAFPGSVSREVLDGTEVSASHVVEAAQSLSLLARMKCVIVREAHALKDIEELRTLWGSAQSAAPADSQSCVCVFLSKDLDGRKKISKEILENAAVVECAEIPDDAREEWVHSLMKSRGVDFSRDPAGQGFLSRLLGMEPWSLDLVNQEFEKLALSGLPLSEALTEQTLGSARAAQIFMDAYFRRDKVKALSLLPAFVREADEVFPLLGLIAWNLRHLALMKQGSAGKLSPWVQDRLRAYARVWDLHQIQEATTALLEVDVALKQRPLDPVGVWTRLIQ